jgi:DNA-binding GntR family transcriptional regulator
MKDTKYEKIYLDLQDKIIQHKIPAGTKLNEKELMEEYSIGRTPFRSIVKQLELEYLVQVIPQSGTYVKTINLDELKDVLEMRIPLELLAAKMIIYRITNEQFEKINYILFNLRKNIETLTLSEVKNYTDQIHNLYYLSSGNEIVTNNLIALHNYSARAWYEYNHEKKSAKNTIHEWTNIMKIIESKNVEELQILVKDHVLNFASSLGLECLQINSNSSSSS